MNERYRIPVELDGEKGTLVVDGTLKMQIQKIVEENAERMAMELYNMDVVLSIKPVEYNPRMKFVARKMSFKDVKVPPFAGKITFPLIKNVVPGTIKDMFTTPCAEIELPHPLPVAPAAIADPSLYPHQCPRCSAPAYIGLNLVDCSRKSCS